MTDKNKHVWEYLAYYLGLAHSPHFAVLVSGPWGVGKTYLVNKFLEGRFGDDESAYVYVSLYGLSSIEEIDDAMFQAIFPALTGTTAKVIGRIAKAGLKFVKLETGDWNIKEFLNKFEAKIYVFDDLERCEAPINKVLGYINQFVEHGGAKVVLIANEEEIGANDDYMRRREKLIGKTLQVQSTFEEAFAHFASDIDNAKARELIQSSAGDIATIYDQSGLNNLRILQQTLWDFERFYAALLPEQQANKEATTTMLRLLFALSFEFKSARIAESDILTGRGVVAMTRAALDKDKPKTRMMIANERYPAVDMNDSILSNGLLVDFLARGIVDAAAIHKELKASRFFVSVEDEASWRTVWNWLERTDADVEAAITQMEDQFVSRAFTREGEILHVLGLHLFLSDRGILPLSRAEVVVQGKRYIDDIYAATKFHITSLGEQSEIRFQAWGGLGFSENETSEFHELFSYLTSAVRRSIEDTYPARAVDLLSDMKTDVDKFYRHLSWTQREPDQYINAPVLAKIAVNDFVDAFLALQPGDQHTVMRALKGRYEGGQLERDLKDEKPWITSVRNELSERTIELGPISQYRLQKFIEWNLPAPG